MTDHSINLQEALIFVMVTMAAVDRDMTDAEMKRIGAAVKNLPVFEPFDADELIDVASRCGEILSREDGLQEVLSLVKAAIGDQHQDTLYALAVDVAAADLRVEQEELRFLQMLRDHLNLDSLTVAAIERGAKARFRKP